MITLVVLIPILVFFLSIARVLHRNAKFSKLNRSLVELLDAHRHAEALQLLEAFPRNAQRHGIRAVRGSLMLALWRPEEARDLLEPVVRRPRLAERPVSALKQPELALAYALLGARAEAQALLQVKPEAPLSVLASAVLAVRASRFDEVRLAMGSRAAYQLAGSYRALSEVLLAWSEEHLDGAAQQRINVVMLWAESGPDALQRCWPELIAAIERLQATDVALEQAKGALTSMP